MRHLILLLMLVSAVSAAAEPIRYGGQVSMNGYRLTQFGNFLKDPGWHFVTVRYRDDSGEMRFVYANSKAWQTLSQGRTDYPDGAVFAKVAVMTTEDPDFTSSKVPGGGKRYQLMVRDRKLYGSDDGWGYALFDVNGRTFNEDPIVQTNACRACHAIVEKRGYVFSEPLNLEVAHQALESRFSPNPSNMLTLIDVPPGSLSSQVREQLPPGARTVRKVSGPLEDAVFQGTLDEIRPTLMKASRDVGSPATLVSRDGKRFTIVSMTSVPCTAASGKTGVQYVVSRTLDIGAIAAERVCGAPAEKRNN